MSYTDYCQLYNLFTETRVQSDFFVLCRFRDMRHMHGHVPRESRDAAAPRNKSELALGASSGEDAPNTRNSGTAKGADAALTQ